MNTPANGVLGLLVVGTLIVAGAAFVVVRFTKEYRRAPPFGRKLGSVQAVSESEFPGMGEAFGLSRDNGYRNYAEGLGDRRDFRVIPSTIPFKRSVFAIFKIDQDADPTPEGNGAQE